MRTGCRLMRAAARLTSYKNRLEGSTMNATEKKYAVKKLNDAARDAYAKIDDRAAVPELNGQEKADLITGGKVKPRKVVKLKTYWNGNYHNPDLDDVFDFSPFKKKAEITSRAADSLRKKIADRLERVTDEIMLGDSKAALAAIQDFAKFCNKIGG